MEEPDETQRGHDGLWWMYPGENSRDYWWIMECAWIWICFFTITIHWIDITYYDGYGSVPIVMGLLMFFILLVTCGRGPCYWIHKDIPWAVLVGSMFVLLFLEIKH